MQYALFHLRVIEIGGRFARNNNEVDAPVDLRDVQPDNLFHHPPDPVAHNGIADFLADGYPQTEMLLLRLRHRIQNELMIGYRFSPAVYVIEIFSFR